MEKIELEKDWIWKEFTYWPNSRTSPAFFLPLPGLPCLARPTRRLPHADALARTPRGPACCPACLVFPPARAPHSSAHRPTAPLARFFITARSLSHCTSAPPVSVFSLLSFLLPRASFFFPGSFLSPAAVSAARMEGHRRYPHMAGDQSRPLPFLFPLAGRPIKPRADPAFSPHLCLLPRATAAGESLPLPSANADAKATRSTAGSSRARRYSPFRVLALFCLATPSPACLFSLQLTAAVDVQPRSLPGRRVPLQATHGEPLHLPVPSDLALAP